MHPIVLMLLHEIDTATMQLPEGAATRARESLLKPSPQQHQAFLDLLVVWNKFDERGVQPLADQLLLLVRLFADVADADPEALRKRAQQEDKRNSVTLPSVSMGSVGMRKR